jgi:catechol 2,3-dioxygenase-like lactoylglutathione lyase family enzyme
MKVERIDGVAINVKNLDEAVKLFSGVLGTTFVSLAGVKAEKTVTEHADSTLDGTKLEIFVDRTGFLALVESDPPVEKEGVRSLRFKVPNIEQARAEMKQKGVRHTADAKVGSMKEAMFSADDLHGVRLILNEYEAPTFVDAMLEK